ncbi:unnamed protein product, partial [Sphacelaria rigidula]
MVRSQPDGKFHEGDCYILMATTQKGAGLAHALHFWIGSESSQGTGIEYLPGGVASGFNKMEKDVFRTRLLHVKGKRVVRCSEVPCSSSSLNTGDVFILDAGLKLFLWSGPEANMYEKSKGLQTMQRIR